MNRSKNWRKWQWIGIVGSLFLAATLITTNVADWIGTTLSLVFASLLGFVAARYVFDSYIVFYEDYKRNNETQIDPSSTKETDGV